MAKTESKYEKIAEKAKQTRTRKPSIPVGEGSPVFVSQIDETEMEDVSGFPRIKPDQIPVVPNYIFGRFLSIKVVPSLKNTKEDGGTKNYYRATFKPDSANSGFELNLNPALRKALRVDADGNTDYLTREVYIARSSSGPEFVIKVKKIKNA